MSYTPCTQSQVQANGVKDCAHPAFEGLKVSAVAFHRNDLVDFVRNGNGISSLSLKTDAKTFVIEAGGETPWADTTEEFDSANGRWNKSVTFTSVGHGHEFSKTFVEPLLTNKDGFVVILQRKDENGVCAFPIIGLEKGAVGASGSLNYTDSATGGCTQITLTESQAPSAEICISAEDYASAKTIFDGLVAKSY